MSYLTLIGKLHGYMHLIYTEIYGIYDYEVAKYLNSIVTSKIKL